MLADFRVRQRDYLLEISRALTQELDQDILLRRILDISIEMLAGKTGLIVLREEGNNWQIRVSQGFPEAYLDYIQPLVKKVLATSNDPEQDELPEIKHIVIDITQNASLGLLVGVGLPLVSRKKLVGVIYIFRDYKGEFSINDQMLLSSFADQAAIAVQNAQLYEEVNREKKRMDALLDSAGDGILILTTGHVVERCNAALGRLLGDQPKNFKGKHHNDVIRWIKPPSGLTLDQAEAGGWPLMSHVYLYVEGDVRRFEDPPSVPVGITYAPMLSDDGTLLNIIVTVRDITRFREAEELKSTFISIVSHELKTPVALIKGYAGTLRREDATWDRAVIKDSLAVIEDEADRLTSMIENLLDASRLQAGGLSINKCDVDLAELSQRILERFKTQTNRHTLLSDFPPDFPVILADDTRIQQVITNLVSNAIKYSPKGEIKIRGRVMPDRVDIGVSDQGPGINPEDVPHVFDRFYRAPDAARKTKGAGLGLYLARAIVEAHGGKIWVDSETGKGTKIWFSLPR